MKFKNDLSLKVHSINDLLTFKVCVASLVLSSQLCGEGLRRNCKLPWWCQVSLVVEWKELG